jgi:Ni/Fe-hydrogenase subunit HybB-like protein
MAKVNAGILLVYVVLRLGDVVLSGKLHHLFHMNGFTALFIIEMVLFLLPAILFLRPSVQRDSGKMFRAALLAVVAGATYRVDTYLSVYRPAPGWTYFPSLGEVVVTIGMAAIGIAVFVFLSRVFPVVEVEATSPAKAGPDTGGDAHGAVPPRRWRWTAAR